MVGLAAAASMVGSLGGCFADTSPMAQIVGAVVKERTEQGVVIDVTIQGANHTNKDLKLSRVDYWMDLDGVRVFEGTRSPQTTFSALGVQTFDVPVAAPIELIPDEPQAQYRVGATIMYLVPGPLAKAFFDLGIHRPSVNIQGSGEIALTPTKVESP